ncbi:Pnpla7 protein [Endogone sp. FLAS-F59071]|nr:Pnpla7 protein [Endogone sp. FLAS-F59071]|eukprot:RUS13415.1 Pnpla7 protein [Endogone sp. FLAS-F59071]
MKTTARKELVLLHSEKSCAHGTTQAWLKNRLWIQAHHHIFMPMRPPNMGSSRNPQFLPQFLRAQDRKNTMGSINTLNSIKGQIEKYYSIRVPTFGRFLSRKSGPSGLQAAASNDFARLARRLCGKSVALVLGGGGARGIGHIGIIRSMEEAGIPIDIIGGTSIGSFVGGLYARDGDPVAMFGRAKMFSGRMTSVWRQVFDLTYPITAWFTGHEFNRGIWKCFMDSQIEDFWLPYFAVTTNITFSRMEVHTKGYAWRYVRASMSLSGYLPPICDNGNMLVDGGYMDNLPVSVAKNMGADVIIAVDVASHDDTSPVHYGDSLSGWWALLQSLNPFWKPNYKIPSIADIQSRLAYVSSVAKLEEAKVTKGCIYMKLPVQKWATLEFDKFDDILKAGYDYGKDMVAKWKKEGIVPGRLQPVAEGTMEVQEGLKAGRIGRRNSI